MKDLCWSCKYFIIIFFFIPTRCRGGRMTMMISWKERSLHLKQIICHIFTLHRIVQTRCKHTCKQNWWDREKPQCLALWLIIYFIATFPHIHGIKTHKMFHFIPKINRYYGRNNTIMYMDITEIMNLTRHI